MTHEIRLYGPIGGFFGFTADEIMAGIPNDATEITLRVHSPGGSVGEGLALYHALRDHNARVRTIVDGYAASAASFLMLAGDDREVHRNSIIFLHNPFTVTQGTADDLRRAANGLDVHAAAILDIYKQRTGMDEGELREMMEETAFFRGEQAKENGFATAVIDDPEAEAQIAAMLDFEGMAAKAKEDAVSKQKTRNEMNLAAQAQTEQIAALEGKVKEAEAKAAEHEQAIEAKAEAVRVEIQAKLDESLAAVAARDAEVAGLTERVTDMEAASAESATQIETILAAKAVAVALAATEKARADKAEQALQNPAFADAALASTTGLPAPYADAEADAAEASAREAAEEQDDAPHYAKYSALMAAGQARQARSYWREHAKEINEEQKALAAQDEQNTDGEEG